MENPVNNLLNVGTTFSVDTKTIQVLALWSGLVVFGAILFNRVLAKFL